jgi:HSP20 family protein
MTIVRFRPDSNRAFRNEFRSLSDMFDSFFTSPFLPEFTPVYRPMVNVRETESEYQMELSVPGFDKKDISLSVEDHVLAIKGQHKEKIKKIRFITAENLPEVNFRVFLN